MIFEANFNYLWLNIFFLGRDGLTHNMLDNIHAHWKRRRVCKIKCKGVCTVDMENVRQHLEVGYLKFFFKVSAILFYYITMLTTSLWLILFIYFIMVVIICWNL